MVAILTEAINAETVGHMSSQVLKEVTKPEKRRERTRHQNKEGKIHGTNKKLITFMFKITGIIE